MVSGEGVSFVHSPLQRTAGFELPAFKVGKGGRAPRGAPQFGGSADRAVRCTEVGLPLRAPGDPFSRFKGKGSWEQEKCVRISGRSRENVGAAALICARRSNRRLSRWDRDGCSGPIKLRSALWRRPFEATAAEDRGTGSPGRQRLVRPTASRQQGHLRPSRGRRDIVAERSMTAGEEV